MSGDRFEVLSAAQQDQWRAAHSSLTSTPLPDGQLRSVRLSSGILLQKQTPKAAEATAELGSGGGGAEPTVKRRRILSKRSAASTAQEQAPLPAPSAAVACVQPCLLAAACAVWQRLSLICRPAAAPAPADPSAPAVVADSASDAASAESDQESEATLESEPSDSSDDCSEADSEEEEPTPVKPAKRAKPQVFAADGAV